MNTKFNLSGSQQLLAYADDDIGRTEADIKKTFIALNEAAVKMGLQVNEEKTKYMICNENKKRYKEELINN